jgi:hypothetical protein
MQKRHHDPTPETKKGFQENPESLYWYWSGRQDLNLRPLVPQTSALPDCATPRAVLTRRLLAPFEKGVKKFQFFHGFFFVPGCDKKHNFIARALEYRLS